MNRKRWILVATLLGVAVLGFWWWRSRAADAAPKYRTAEVDRGSIESVVSATGTIRPVVQVEIGSQVSGTVDKLHADFNSRVRAGQIIVELEKSSFRAREVQAEAAVTRAEASVKDAERALARARELFARNYVSQADLDAATVALELRKADLKQALAQLEAARVDLRHATIRSPIDGIVTEKKAFRGHHFEAGTMLYTVSDISTVFVFAGLAHFLAAKFVSDPVHLLVADVTGASARYKGFAEQCMAEYNLDGWIAPDMIKADDIRAIGRRVTT